MLCHSWLQVGVCHARAWRVAVACYIPLSDVDLTDIFGEIPPNTREDLNSLRAKPGTNSIPSLVYLELKLNTIGNKLF